MMNVSSSYRTGSSNVAPRIRSRNERCERDVVDGYFIRHRVLWVLGTKRRRPVWLFQVCMSAGTSTLMVSAACVVAAWVLSLVASTGSQLAVYGQSPQ